MAEGIVGRNLTFPILNSDGTTFHNLVFHKAVYDTVVMALGDKITGDVYYPDNTLSVTMSEYIEYNGVKYVLVTPPTIVREGMVSDNSELKGMTKYSFTFYHPMYMLANFPFSDIAVSSDQQRYLSENKQFAWIGYLSDYVAKINKNLQGTEWICVIGSSVPQDVLSKISDVLTFDEQTIADALKTGYETWEVPYVIDVIKQGEQYYSQGKRFKIQFGLPSDEIYALDGQGNRTSTPFVFHFGQGVGLKNNSRTPRNNKIVTRLSGYGSEDNIPYGYPQIQWTGNQSWDYTINNDPTDPNSYPIYDGIVGGQSVRLIKHPFTRKHLMPSVYVDRLNKKVNPLATGYDPTIELVDYYDADNTYPNPINPLAPSYDIHGFEKIKPELGEKNIVAAFTFDEKENAEDFYTLSSFVQYVQRLITQTSIDIERAILNDLRLKISSYASYSNTGDEEQYWYDVSFSSDSYYAYVDFESANINFTATVQRSVAPSPEWNDNMDGDGNYEQSYFKITLPSLGFDLYACAAVTQEMKIFMRGGACIGCTFPIMVDWDDYKKNFYDEDGKFAPSCSQRDFDKYPDSTSSQITVIVQKDIDTFGTLMPNIYQQPSAGDQFVILGISLPISYVTDAQGRLDAEMLNFLRDNNVHYFDYPLKFDEYFLANNTGILTQMKPNVIVRFDYAGTVYALYIRQMSVKFGDGTLPKYDITLTDDVEIVLNQIGQVADEVSRLRLTLGEEGSGMTNDKRYLRKDKEDTDPYLLRLITGLQVGNRFVTGLLGEGGIFRKDSDGTTYIEADKLYIRMRAYFDTVEVKHYLHSGGNRIASKAGIRCSRVEYINSDGNVTSDINQTVKFRCYFKANDNDKVITNDFVVGDLAFCEETNVDVQEVDKHRYWRAIVSKSSEVSTGGEHYIDLSASDCENGSDIPIAQDDIIQLGNKTDTTRQGAIIEFVGGDDAPSYQIYQGISTYSLVGKNYVSFGYDSQSGSAQAYIGNPDGSTYLWYHTVNNVPQLDIKANVTFTSPDPEYGTSDLNAFIQAVTNDVDNIHNQIDGQIESWFYDYMPVREDEGAPADTVPLTNKEPYKSWYQADHGGTASEVTTERLKHLGDTFYDNTSGYAFRFSNTGTEQSPVFAWVVIQDSAVIKALADAEKAQDTADHKRRVFVAQPTDSDEYDVGDLWVNATYPATGTKTYDNDLLRCKTHKDAGDLFSIAHWELATNYGTKLTDFINNTYSPFVTDIQNQVDQKAETWYQNTDPSTAWTTTDLKNQHKGDIWHNTSNTTINGVESDRDAIWTGTAWKMSDVPQSVYDTIDGKADIFVSRPTTYNKYDLWIIESGLSSTYMPTGCVAGDIVISSNKRTNSYQKGDWTKKDRYTDDSSLLTFLDGYSGTLTDVRDQIDEKAETWYYNQNPATTARPNGWLGEDNADHVGDLWYCTADIANTNFKKDTTWYYKVTGGTAQNPTYGWVQQNIPQSVFDTIDGKKAIYVTWNGWVVSNVNKLQVRDLFIPQANVTKNSVTYKANKVYRCLTVGVYNSSGVVTTYPTFQEVAYTDDTTVNSIITKYGEILGITPTASGVGEALGKLRKVLGSSTEISGGLVLTNIIYMKDTASTPAVQAGLSGLYQSSPTGTGYKGNGTAAWFGGGVSNGVPIDMEVSGTSGNYAKTLFRFDGSGYLASGNISWDASGTPTIKGNKINVNTLVVGEGNTTNVALATDLASYLPLSAGSGKKLTGTLYSQSILPKSTTTYDLGGTSNYWNKVYTKKIYLTDTVFFELDSSNNVKLNGNFCATGSVSALGSGTGGGGGITLNKPLSTINTAFGNANPTSANQTLVWNGSTWTYGSVSGGSVDMTDVWTAMAGNTTEQINSSHLTTALADYLPLSGGTLTGALIINSGTLYPLTIRGNSANTDIHFLDGNGNYVIDLGWSESYSKAYLAYCKSSSYGLISVDHDGCYFTDSLSNYSKYTIWHSGNDGANSGLDADLLDGQHGSYYATVSSLSLYLPLTGGAINNDTLIPLTITGNNDYSIIRYIGRDTSTDTYNSDIGLSVLNKCSYIAYHENSYYGIISVDLANAYYSDTVANFKKYILLNSGNIGSYNAGSATKLQTARTIWGQSFDGTANVDGAINMVVAEANSIKAFSAMSSAMTANNNIYLILGQAESTGNSGAVVFTYQGVNNANNSLNLGTYGRYKLLNILNSGNVGIGTTSPSTKLEVSGTFNATSNSTIGGTLGVTGATSLSSTLSVADAITLSGSTAAKRRIYFGDTSHYIELDSTGFHFSHGLYSDSFISAFGAQTGSGGITLNQPLSGINSSGLGTPSNGQTLVYNSSTSKWTYQTLNTSGVDMAAVWTAMATPAASSSVEQIDASHLATALSGYVTQVKVGTIAYTPVNGIVTLPAYPTKASWDYDDVYVKYSYATNDDIDNHNNIFCFFNGQNVTTPLVSGFNNYWYVLNLGKYSSGYYTVQLASPYYSGISEPQLFIRKGTNTTWSAWRQVWHDGNDGAGSGLDADLLDGQDGSYYATAASVTSVSNSLANYLHLTGGTLTGTLNLTPSSGTYSLTVRGTTNSVFQFKKPSDGTAGTDFGYNSNGRFYAAYYVSGGYRLFNIGSDGIFYSDTLSNWTKYPIIHSGNIANYNAGSATKLQTSRTIWGQSFDGSANVTGDMSSVGDIAFSASGKKIGGFLYFDTTNSCLGINTNSPAEKLHVAGNVTLSADSRIYQQYSSSGDLYLGRSDNSGWVRISDMCSNDSKTYWAIYANGEFKARKYTFLKTSDGSDSGCYFQWDSGSIVKLTGSLYVTGGVTALTTSDIRKKNISSNVDKLTVEDVADAPIFNFTWKNMIDNKMHLGTSAQYWHPLLQNAVSIMDDGYLGMDYGATALAAAVITARKVVDHETRIRQLEEENKRLRYELETIKAA